MTVGTWPGQSDGPRGTTSPTPGYAEDRPPMMVSEVGMASVATPGSLECLASMSKVAAFQATEERRLESALVRPL